jgi:hypothetical protein
MFEVVLVALFAAALIPPMYLLSRVSILKNRVEQALAVSSQSDEYMHTLIAAQRDLVRSFDVFDSLLACLQYSREALGVTARSFICAFRERATSYVERGCEGSLLNTHIREDRLKQLALTLMQQHETDLSRHGYGPLQPDALDNGDLAEYLKLLKYIVQCYLSHIEGLDGDQAGTPRLTHAAVL